MARVAHAVPGGLARRKAAARSLVSVVDDHVALGDISKNCYGRDDTSASWIGPFVPVTNDSSFRSFNNIAASDLSDWARAHWMIYDSLIDEFCSAEGDVLDVGCGSGNTTLLLATIFANNRVVGLDSDKKAIRFCKKYNSSINVEYRHSSLEKYGEQKGRKFRYVFACEVLEHMRYDRQERFIRTCLGMLAGDGLLFMTTPNALDEEPTGHHCGLLNRGRFVDLYPSIRPLVRDFSYFDNSALKACGKGADAVIRGAPEAFDMDDSRNRSHFRLVLAPAPN